MTQTMVKNYYNDFAYTNPIVEAAVENIELVFDKLGIECEKRGKMYVGKCPIHDGDNESALNLYVEGDIVGNWKCRSHHCEQKYSRSFIGFIRGVLSKIHGKDVKWKNAVDWLCSITNSSIDNNGSQLIDLDKLSFERTINLLKSKKPSQTNIIKKSYVLESLDIPAQYYINRGYSKEILIKYDIGLCKDESKRMRYRVVVPFYDINGKNIIGCTGRCIFDKCDKCKLYHNEKLPCPTQEWEKVFSQKWLLSKNFNDKHHLYNYWFSKDYIRKSNVAIIVESAGDLLKLEECKIHNAVSTSGIELTDAQASILEASGALCLIVIYNNDKAGIEGYNKIKEQYSRFFNILKIDISEYNDLGDASMQYINEKIKPEIIKVVKEYA